ncbi:MAG: T9SS type A sorting domain-containing protein [Saprospiraceae bacterium]|nr:T9SS type A sorting domain-containing protein [Saprospiraceae bacterium]
MYRIYMEYIKTDSITTDDKGVLTLLSRECSDLYGDVIHLARYMVNTYSMTYFDVFDGCGTELRYSRKRDQQDISVFPNPTEGKVYVRFQEAFDGVLDITDATGKVITQKKIKNSNTLEIDLFKKNGVYIFRFSNDEGNVINKKIVLIE